jgi:hypothetical protein
VYLRIHWADFPETSYPAILTHDLQALQGSLGYLTNTGYFTWRTKSSRSIKIKGTLIEQPCFSWSAFRLPLDYFSESSYLALRTHGLQILRAGSHWLPIKTLYLENKVRFRLISATMGAIFLTIHPSHYPDMRHKHFKFRYNQSLIKSTLIGEQCTSSALFLLTFGRVS